MSIVTYSEIGKELLRWGWSFTTSIKDKIKSLTDAERQIALLAAVLQELRDLNQLTIATRKSPTAPATKAQSHHIADGTLVWLQLARGDKPIKGFAYESGLSVRAMRVLRRSGIEWLSEITPERLSEVRNCGEVTIREIMDWRHREQLVGNGIVAENESQDSPATGE